MTFVPHGQLSNSMESLTRRGQLSMSSIFVGVREGSGTIYHAMSLLAVLLVWQAGRATAQNPSSAGFINIDCGLNVTSYTDPEDGLVYSSDAPYTSTGVNREVSPAAKSSQYKDYYNTVRSFPDGVRNCYTLVPVNSGSKYRVTAEFSYGNYDGLLRPPTFDLYVGVNLWATVETNDFNRKEVITVAVGENIQLCLVNTGKGTPFISMLNLRPLPFPMYSPINDSSSAVFNVDRKNYGTTKLIRFPDDIYDRMWLNLSTGVDISTSQNVSLEPFTEFLVPQAILQTASVAKSLTDAIEISIPGKADEPTYVYMYFAELQVLASNETREFSVYEGSKLLYGWFRPRFLEEDMIYTLPPGGPGGVTYYLRATPNSTLPPMINAHERFSVIRTPLRPTNESDVDAILPIKKLVNGSRNWEGDPCVPREMIWKGLGCGYDEFKYSRISSLDLSRSGLSGPIPGSIANLTSLSSLNLSYNNLIGEIPTFLGEMPALKFLNLEGNNLSGTIPATLAEKSKNGSLKLIIEDKLLCGPSDICGKEDAPITPHKKKLTLPIVLGVIAAVVSLLVIIFITFLIIKRRKTKSHQLTPQGLSAGQLTGVYTAHTVNGEREPHYDNSQFSKADIIKITKNFMHPIGKGGFSTVYHGVLDDGTEVAVKVMSTSSVNGEKQFKAEAELLTRVHHRCLVSLLGYCNENLALVYEYVPQGSLADHLSAGSENKSILSWNDRLRIALDAAEGLSYLHYGCKPPIIHRDVKPSNFLLTEKFEVKIADFGLSRYTVDGHKSFVPTFVAGTPGYMDPEYQHTYKLSEKSDVYSFGVVLLELMTGKPPITVDGVVTHMAREVRNKMERGDLSEILDPNLHGNYDVNSVWRLIEIALSCTSFNSKERPRISDVAVQLKECLADKMTSEFNRVMNSLVMYPDDSAERPTSN